MHDQALAWLAEHAELIAEGASVVEFGAREVGGPTVRSVFPNREWVGVDPVAGPGVDVVANAATWKPDDPVDAVVCCEVFEHTPHWPAIVANGLDILRSGGVALFTCAGPGRPEHGVGIDDPDQPGYYANVSADDLATIMRIAGFERVTTCQGLSYAGLDTYAVGWKP